jgi:DNA-binding transcriptional regulator YdaS (Cro superfamily)
MTAKQFRAALTRLDLTQIAAAKLFDVNASTVRRWASGAVPVPFLVDMLLTFAIEGKIKTTDIRGFIDA